jgi:hypothetical protein
MNKLPAGRKKRITIVACMAAIPLSIWCFNLAKQAVFPSRWLRQLLGPQERTEHTSAPDYMEWDIATMMLMLAVCGASVIYLGTQIVLRLRRALHQ